MTISVINSMKENLEVLEKVIYITWDKEHLKKEKYTCIIFCTYSFT